MTESQSVLVDCITLHHLYRGWLDTNGNRISDELSSVASDFITLKDVQITGAARNTPSVECSVLTLQKNRILVAMPRDSHERSGNQRINKFQKKDRRGVVVVLPGHILSGVVQLPKTSASWTAIRKNGAVQPFFGLTDVTVHNAVFRLTPHHCPVAIVQRDAVEAIEIAASSLSEPSLVEAFAEE